MYPVSYLFSVPSAAYITMIVVNLFVGLTATMATFVLDLFDSDPDLSATNAVLKQAFLIFPNYCLGRGILDVARHEYQAQYDEVASAVSNGSGISFTNPIAWHIVGRNLFLMAIQAVFWLLITVALEHRMSLQALWRRLRHTVLSRCGVVTATPKLDDRPAMGTPAISESTAQTAYASVAAERDRVMQPGNDDHLRVVDLCKSYQRKDISRCGVTREGGREEPGDRKSGGHHSHRLCVVEREQLENSETAVCVQWDWSRTRESERKRENEERKRERKRLL